MLSDNKGVEEDLIAGTHIAFASTPGGTAHFEYEKLIVRYDPVCSDFLE